MTTSRFCSTVSPSVTLPSSGPGGVCRITLGGKPDLRHRRSRATLAWVAASSRNSEREDSAPLGSVSVRTWPAATPNPFGHRARNFHALAMAPPGPDVMRVRTDRWFDRSTPTPGAKLIRQTAPRQCAPQSTPLSARPCAIPFSTLCLRTFCCGASFVQLFANTLLPRGRALAEVHPGHHVARCQHEEHAAGPCDGANVLPGCEGGVEDCVAV